MRFLQILFVWSNLLCFFLTNKHDQSLAIKHHFTISSLIKIIQKRNYKMKNCINNCEMVFDWTIVYQNCEIVIFFVLERNYKRKPHKFPNSFFCGLFTLTRLHLLLSLVTDIDKASLTKQPFFQWTTFCWFHSAKQLFLFSINNFYSFHITKQKIFHWTIVFVVEQQ